MCRLYKIGDRVLYTQPTHIHKSALPYKAQSFATVISAYGGETKDCRQGPTYQLELDAVWTERENRMFVGEKIIVGSIRESYLLPVLLFQRD